MGVGAGQTISSELVPWMSLFLASRLAGFSIINGDT